MDMDMDMDMKTELGNFGHEMMKFLNATPCVSLDAGDILF